MAKGRVERSVSQSVSQLPVCCCSTVDVHVGDVSVSVLYIYLSFVSFRLLWIPQPYDSPWWYAVGLACGFAGSVMVTGR